jgi:hypothetical protein
MCARRQADSDPPRYCPRCARKLRVQVLPLSVHAECVSCGPLPQLTGAGGRSEAAR